MVARTARLDRGRHLCDPRHFADGDRPHLPGPGRDPDPGGARARLGDARGAATGRARRSRALRGRLDLAHIARRPGRSADPLRPQLRDARNPPRRPHTVELAQGRHRPHGHRRHLPRRHQPPPSPKQRPHPGPPRRQPPPAPVRTLRKRPNGLRRPLHSRRPRSGPSHRTKTAAPSSPPNPSLRRRLRPPLLHFKRAPSHRPGSAGPNS